MLIVLSSHKLPSAPIVFCCTSTASFSPLLCQYNLTIAPVVLCYTNTASRVLLNFRLYEHIFPRASVVLCCTEHSRFSTPIVFCCTSTASLVFLYYLFVPAHPLEYSYRTLLYQRSFPSALTVLYCTSQISRCSYTSTASRALQYYSSVPAQGNLVLILYSAVQI